MNKTTLFICLLFSMSLSAKPIYKCKLNGKITFSNFPCNKGTNKTIHLRLPNLTDAVKKAPKKLIYSDNYWFKDMAGYKAAIKESIKYQTPLFIYFQADWCSYCRRLERELLTTQSARTILNQYIKVQITPDHGSDEKNFFKYLGGTGYPTIMVQNNPKNRPRIFNTMNKRGNQWRVISERVFEERLSKYSY